MIETMQLLWDSGVLQGEVIGIIIGSAICMMAKGDEFKSITLVEEN